MRNYIAVAVLALLLGAALTRYYLPRVEVQVKETVKTVTQVKVRTITRIVERPDGSKETVTETTDNTTRTGTGTKVQTTFATAQYLLSGTVTTPFDRYAPSYGVQAQRRIMGPLWLGLGANTDKTVTAILTLEF